MSKNFDKSDLGIENSELDKNYNEQSEKEGLISRKFARRKRCCWGGMARCPFYCLLGFVISCILLAILVPILLYVILPQVTQSSVNDSTLAVPSMAIQSWDVVPGSVEAEHYATYLPMFAGLCKNSSLADKQTFLNSRVKDVLGCISPILDILFERPTSGPYQMLAFLICANGCPLQNIGLMTWQQFFNSLEMESCSNFNPASVQGSMTVTMDKIPSFLKGGLSESYVDLYGPKDNPGNTTPWGRIAIPAMSLNNKQGDLRIVENINVTIKIFDRMRFLLNNFNLMALEPLTTGKTTWKQDGSLTVNIDLAGVQYHFPVTLNKNTVLSNAKFNSGPFSVMNHDAGLPINSPTSFIGCLLLDLLPSLLNPNASSPIKIPNIAGILGRRSVTDLLEGECASSNFEDMSPIDFSNPDKVNKISRCVVKAVSVFSPAFLNKKSGAISQLIEQSQLNNFAIANVYDKFQSFLEAEDKQKFLFGDDETEAKLQAEEKTKLYESKENRRRAVTSSYLNCTVNKTTGESCPFTAMKQPYVVQPDDNTDGIDPRCLLDQILPGTGDQIKTPYRFTVHPGSGVNKSNVLLYFQGGGADWNELLNDASQLVALGEIMNMSSLIPKVLKSINTGTMTANPHEMVGVFDQNNPQNPFRTWTIVSVLYCSGDVHGGNHTQKPTSQLLVNRYRHGYSNTMSVFNWMKKQPELAVPKELVLMGCSAGALGAQVWAAKAQEILKTNKNNTLVFVDSYIGVFDKNQNLEDSHGTFGLKGYAKPNQTEATCYNVSSNFVTDTKLSAPIGKVVNNDWGLCDVMKTYLSGLVTPEIIAKCNKNEFDIHEFFNMQFNHADSPIYFINSKADHVQRLFGTMVGFTVSRDTGLKIKTLPSVDLVPDPINCTAGLASGNLSHCELLPSCITNGAQNNYSYYNNLTYTKTDPMVGLYLLEFLLKMDSSSKVGNFLNVVVNKLASQFVQYQMGAGAYGQQNYWVKAAEMVKSYSTKKKSWFMVNSKQHCYTCFNYMYEQNVNGELMVDWIQKGVNNLLNKNSKITPPICDKVDSQFPTCV